MIKKIVFFIFLLTGLITNAQIKSKEFRTKTFTLVKDSVHFDTVNINSQRFKVFNDKNQLITTKEYQVNFIKAILIINSKKYSKIKIEYFVFPDFVTKVYKKFDKALIVPNTENTKKLYSLTTNKTKKRATLFNDLETSGNITRGLTIGNNQNSVTNSSLDLTIKGNLSKDVTIKANIFDTNIPLQENGYSQNITDFDRIFIEFEHEKWRVKAGDLDIKNTSSYFMPFTKKVSGLEVEAKLSNQLNTIASGAIVRGQFNSFKFAGREGNQGPYKIIGTNNETFIIIIAGSETLYVNGRVLKRGIDKDYTIDYNNSEIRFNTTFPVTNDMRFHLDYQYSNNNYTRFITYEEVNYKKNNWAVNGYFYNENDAKNQPIQQTLSDAQKQILANSGNDITKMFSNSAYKDVYSDSRISYKKIIVGAIEVYEYSTNLNDEHFNVTFTNVGSNKGDYVLDRTIAIGNIYKYVGTNLGSFNPVIRLIAPSKSQIFAINGAYISKKTNVFSEIAISNNDLNLFSNIDNSQNKGTAFNLNWKQILVDKKWKLSTELGFEYLHQNFNAVQRFQSVEFERDWNIFNPKGNRNTLNLLVNLKNNNKSFYQYGLYWMNYSENYNGIKHIFKNKTVVNNTTFSSNFSLLNNTSAINENIFLRTKGKIEHSFNKSWIGGFIDVEKNEIKNKTSNQVSNLSHQYKEFETFFGLGDSTKVFAKIGFNFRQNDSIRNNNFTRINTRNTYYILSKLIQNKKTNLSVFANYRTTNNNFLKNEQTLNSKVIYGQNLFNNLLRFNTIYETSSGNIPRQEYIYIQTEPGQGYFTWIDYNNNGVKEFNEFEIAIYKDQAEYLRIALPNLNFINTQRIKLSHNFTINLSRLKEKNGFLNILSHFHNQVNFSINNEQERNNNSFNFNPFDINDDKLLGLNYSLRNRLYFNKNLDKFSTIFTFAKSKNKQLFQIGTQEFNTKLHELEINHKVGDFWLINLIANQSKDDVNTENFSNQNYKIKTYELAPKFTYQYNKNNQFSFFYSYKDKRNEIENLETLNQQKLGTSYYLKSKKNTVFRAEFNLFFNNFSGNNNSPVAYQMLEGLQSGKNYTWSIIYQQKINSFININLNYLARKSETSRTIHIGSVQLRADF